MHAADGGRQRKAIREMSEEADKRAMKKRTILIIACGIVVVALAAGIPLAAYWKGLHPALVMQLPREKCPPLSFDRRGLARGPAVDAVCGANGLSNGPFFALTGKKAVRFVPHVFHGVHGSVASTDADPAIAYFYRYDKRYRPIIDEP